jgi:hypothetical protein
MSSPSRLGLLLTGLGTGGHGRHVERVNRSNGLRGTGRESSGRGGGCDAARGGWSGGAGRGSTPASGGAPTDDEPEAFRAAESRVMTHARKLEILQWKPGEGPKRVPGGGSLLTLALTVDALVIVRWIRWMV